MLRSYAQNLEDVVLWRALGDVANGTYVDVGAADPVLDSVTKHFYDRGWSGIDVEPVHDLATRLRRFRPRDTVFEECAGDAAGTLVLHEVSGTGLSTADRAAAAALVENGEAVREVTVAVRRLDTMLGEALETGSPIHFLKVDVEGFERQVLEGIDLDVWRPWVVVVEATRPRTGEPTYTDWEAIVLARDYRFCLFDGLNRFYVAAEHAALAAPLSYPACVFDQPFLTPAHAILLDEYESLLKSTQDVQSAYDGALASYADLQETYQEALDAYRRLESLRAADHDRASSRIADFEASLATLRQGVVELTDEAEAAREEASRYRQLHDQLIGSTSWRITAPLRRATDLGKAIARRRRSAG